MSPLVVPNYVPHDVDERGLWRDCEKFEQEIASSNFVVRDGAVSEYIASVAGRVAAEHKSNLRVYVLKDPSFNASMYPNGMMLVHTGLLARAQDEAQLAAVLGHETGHYLRRHSVRGWRDRKFKSALSSVVVVASAGVAGGTGDASWIDLANNINVALVASVFSFSREMESEADAYGVRLIADAGYEPKAASEVWLQLIEERRASAQMRKKKYRDRSISAFSTHPPSENRMLDLAASAAEVSRESGSSHDRQRYKEQFRSAISPMRYQLLDEQIKLNDPGASLYLLASHARDGWDGMLRFFQGEAHTLRQEPGDLDSAFSAYSESVTLPGAPAEAFRAYGYALIARGQKGQGRAALRRYIELKPDAPDAAMTRFSVEQ